MKQRNNRGARTIPDITEGKLLCCNWPSTTTCCLSQHNILWEEQHGFRQSRSCETQLVITIPRILLKVYTEMNKLI